MKKVFSSHVVSESHGCGKGSQVTSNKGSFLYEEKLKGPDLKKAKHLRVHYLFRKRKQAPLFFFLTRAEGMQGTEQQEN